MFLSGMAGIHWPKGIGRVRDGVIGPIGDAQQGQVQTAFWTTYRFGSESTSPIIPCIVHNPRRLNFRGDDPSGRLLF
jgi:hypothetical protein